ncbi:MULTISPECIES: GtrA family protein [unclassified Microcystis]|jgi:putative flippase GtrA|uniref:GtrA family protein n=1 Tax=Microcystis flos-aquae Mf_QC_C_20070823_S10D TaxID=2486236 RepID=A0A552KTT3_9CHRO|nr:GtrA family protein [Microcystis sp. M091S2]MCA2646659.1 GtrA family protein [Microcystis sp. M069S2]MCA2662776.1 GtrA family protein [Microcystis sp. M064S2]MCA2674229.1 GtrA family protein [Microcystis sp. M054S2]MCA2771575.1 GtrA family protein [Microcystis sp. M122S2]MCA2787215.1 GtrA family protein [Microcystis sp. M116S2]MCA2794648.1 GtrA family protein [Microcystis sp. M100S2]MCA2816091.1 GtrA family protein [Microcystis sp. M085S1]MCA2819682.1 GtrA family protein [Microcystis sp.
MKKRKNWLLRDIYSWKFLRFVLVGSLGYISSILIIYLLTEKLKLHYIISWQVAWFFSNLLTFYTNKLYTFNSKKRNFWFEIWRYYLVNSSSLFFAIIGVYVMVEAFRVNYLIASVLVSLISLFYNFILHKKWSFK